MVDRNSSSGPSWNLELQKRVVDVVSGEDPVDAVSALVGALVVCCSAFGGRGVFEGALRLARVVWEKANADPTKN